MTTTTELREAIKATLRRRSPKAVSVMLVCELGDVEWEITETIDNSPDEDVGYIADLLGLRPDGSDPAEDMKRVTAERDEGIDRLRLADQLWRVHEMLCELVRQGAYESAKTLVQELDSGVVKSGAKAVREGDGVRLTGWAIEGMASAVAEQLDAVGAKNHAMWTLSFPDGRRLDMTGEWAGRVTIAERITKAETCLAELSAAIRYEREVRAAWRALIADGSSNKGLADAALASVENTTGEVLKAIEAAQ